MKYSLGANRNPIGRQLKEYAVTDVALPPSIITDISLMPVLDQGQIGSCVGHAVATALNYDFYKKTGIVIKDSARWNYAVGKLIDGNTNEGTCALSVFQGLQKQGGTATINTVPDDITLTPLAYTELVITPVMTQDASQYPVNNEVEIGNPTSQQLMSLIQKYGVVAIALTVDEQSWMVEDGQGALLPGTAGGHEVALYGYEVIGNDIKFYIRNSWNTTWGQGGNGWFMWSAYNGSVYDAMAFTVTTQPTMPNVFVKRGWNDSVEAIGRLTIQGDVFSCYTLEPEGASQIPPGTYQCNYSFMPSHNVWHYELTGGGLQGYFIHAGNYYTDTNGCILLGHGLADLNGDGIPDVDISALTVAQFEGIMGKKPFTITIS